MDIKRILGAVDHTLLAPECTWEQIQALYYAYFAGRVFSLSLQKIIRSC